MVWIYYYFSWLSDPIFINDWIDFHQLKVFVVVIPKEGWTRVAAFGMTPTFQNLTLLTS